MTVKSPFRGFRCQDGSKIVQPAETAFRRIGQCIGRLIHFPMFRRPERQNVSGAYRIQIGESVPGVTAGVIVACAGEKTEFCSVISAESGKRDRGGKDQEIPVPPHGPLPPERSIGIHVAFIRGQSAGIQIQHRAGRFAVAQSQKTHLRNILEIFGENPLDPFDIVAHSAHHLIRLVRHQFPWDPQLKSIGGCPVRKCFQSAAEGHFHFIAVGRNDLFQTPGRRSAGNPVDCLASVRQDTLFKFAFAVQQIVVGTTGLGEPGLQQHGVTP